MAKLTPITELDFDSIKAQLKSYLQQQTQFKDYNFEGSNMAAMLDVLAYNTFQNNFYTNMAISEMFLDSAQLRNSIVSHAKELNYLPRSRKSAKAVVRVTILDTENVIETQTITIPKYTEFNATYLGETYIFHTNEAYIARKISPTTYQTENMEIFEGDILSSFEREGFIVDEDGVLRVQLTNENVDTDSLEVFVDAEATEDENVYLRRDDIFGVGPTDKVFYVEPYFDNRYSIYFGNNVYGEQPSEFEDVRVRYRVTSGAEANGASKFTTTFLNNITATVTTISPASGGQERETLESIRFNAPKALQIQERAVTTNDYEILLKQRFSEIAAVAAYSGDELDPPQFGKVAISVYLEDEGALISSSLAQSYIEYLQDKTPLSIEPIFVQTKFVYADIEVNVFYTKKTTKRSKQELESLVRQKISEYSDTNLENFNTKLRLSKLTSEIDGIDGSILSTGMTAKPIIEWSPSLNVTLNPTFRFNTELVKPYPFRSANGFKDYKPAIRSSTFDLEGGVCVYFQDDGLGNIQVITDDPTNPSVITPNIGSINYETGELKLVNIKVEDYPSSAIQIVADSKRKDILAPKGRVFIIRDTDVKVNIFAEEEQSVSTTSSTTASRTISSSTSSSSSSSSGSSSY